MDLRNKFRVTVKGLTVFRPTGLRSLVLFRPTGLHNSPHHLMADGFKIWLPLGAEVPGHGQCDQTVQPAPKHMATAYRPKRNGNTPRGAVSIGKMVLNMRAATN